MYACRPVEVHPAAADVEEAGKRMDVDEMPFADDDELPEELRAGVLPEELATAVGVTPDSMLELGGGKETVELPPPYTGGITALMGVVRAAALIDDEGA